MGKPPCMYKMNKELKKILKSSRQPWIQSIQLTLIFSCSKIEKNSTVSVSLAVLREGKKVEREMSWNENALKWKFIRQFVVLMYHFSKNSNILF